jgi:hypothetical protein
MQRMKELFIQVLLQKEVLAFHDTPYALFPRLFHEAVQDVYGVSLTPKIVMSERSPRPWALSRLHKHSGYCCRDNYDQIDFQGCIERALERHRQKTDDVTAPLLFSETFLDFHNQQKELLESHDESTMLKATDGTRHRLDAVTQGFEIAMQQHLERFHNNSIYAFDVFSQESKVPVSQLVSDIGRSLPPSLMVQNKTHCVLKMSKFNNCLQFDKLKKQKQLSQTERAEAPVEPHQVIV